MANTTAILEEVHSPAVPTLDPGKKKKKNKNKKEPASEAAAPVATIEVENRSERMIEPN